jgi:hypothetical protein
MDERQRRVDHFNAGAAGSERESSWEAESRAPVRQLHGTKDIEGLFPPRSAPTTTVPFPSGSRSKTEPRFNQEAVTAELNRPPRTVDIDPRILSAGQPQVTRAGVEHYLGGTYEKTGETYEPGHNVGNQFPFVVTKRTSSPNQEPHEHLIISGHHRAAAALLKGEKLTTRWIEQ